MSEENKIISMSGIQAIDRILQSGWKRKAHYLYQDMGDLLLSLAKVGLWNQVAAAATFIDEWKSQMSIATSMLPKIQQLRQEDFESNSGAAKYRSIARELVTEIYDMEEELRRELAGTGLWARLFKAIEIALIGLEIAERLREPTGRSKECTCSPWYGHHFKDCPEVATDVEIVVARGLREMSGEDHERPEKEDRSVEKHIHAGASEWTLKVLSGSSSSDIIRILFAKLGKQPQTYNAYYLEDKDELTYVGVQQVPDHCVDLRLIARHPESDHPEESPAAEEKELENQDDWEYVCPACPEKLGPDPDNHKQAYTERRGQYVCYWCSTPVPHDALPERLRGGEEDKKIFEAYWDVSKDHWKAGDRSWKSDPKAGVISDPPDVERAEAEKPVPWWDVECIINGNLYLVESRVGKDVYDIIYAALYEAGLDADETSAWVANTSDGLVLEQGDSFPRAVSKIYITRPPGEGA